MKKHFLKFIALILCFLLCFEQSAFAQVTVQLDIAGHLNALHNSLIQDKFRPLHLRYLAYDTLSNKFNLLLDKGDAGPQVTSQASQVEAETANLMKYFFIGVTLPNDSFWVNLRPDSPEQIIDDRLAQTDIGKIMLETDLQLKKDTAMATSPETPEGKEYWGKLYKKAEELFGIDTVTIPTLTRPWIVPGEIIISETADSAYIYKATLKVMLAEDYLKNTPNAINAGILDYTFKDQRSQALNEYSTQLIRELIIPKLTKEINISKRYASLRQVYYSLILAQWFKARHKGVSPNGTVSKIDSNDLTNLTSKESWSKNTYFKQYQKSFKDGEYNIQEPVYTPTGQMIRSYFSGGISGFMSQPQVTRALTRPIGDAANSTVLPAAASSISREYLISGVYSAHGQIIEYGVVRNRDSLSHKETEESSASSTVDPFMDLQLRPNPLGLISISEEDIIKAGQNHNLPTDLKNLKPYKRNLQQLLPYYRDMVEVLLSQYPDFHFIFLGRDAELLYDAMAVIAEGTSLEDKVMLLPFSTKLYESEEAEYYVSREMVSLLGQFIDMKAAGEGTKKYLIVDTGFVGNTIAFINDVVRENIGLENKNILARDVNGSPLNGILIRVKGPQYLFEQLKPRYPQFKLGDYGKDFVFPKIVRYAAQDINFKVAAATQLMPKFMGHTDILVQKRVKGKDILLPTSSEKTYVGLEDIKNARLGPSESFSVVATSVSQLNRRLDWHAPIDPVSATILQAEVVKYFYHLKNEILTRVSIDNSALNSNIDSKKQSSSSVGGIDFRTLPIVTQAMTNLSANISSSALCRLKSVNLEEEWQSIERMSLSGIKPSAERIIEYARASSALNMISQDKDKIVLCISDILRQEEEEVCETAPVLVDILAVLQSGMSTQELKTIFTGK